MTTIKDIAKVANVSVATVSMALNNKAGISAETKAKIVKLAKEMDYTPSLVAQALKTKSSHKIAVVVGNIRNPYSVDIIASAEKVVNELEYNILVACTQVDMEKTIKVLKKYNKHFIDGILFSVPIEPTKELIAQLHQLMDSGVKVISLVKSLEGHGIPMVCYREQEKIAHLLSQLVSLGHKNIAIVDGGTEIWHASERMAVFESITNAYGIYHEDYRISCTLDGAGVVEKTMELLSRHPEITAIFAINDIFAVRVLQAAKKMGLRVPEDLSIIGCDGIEFVEFASPNITTVVTPREEMGTIATQKLIQMIENKPFDERESIILPCSCYEGGSIGRAPHRE